MSGRVSIDRETLPVGSDGPLTITYRPPEEGLPTFGGVRFYIPPPFAWPSLDDPDQLGFSTVRVEGSEPAPPYEAFIYRRRWVQVEFPKGAPAGVSVVLEYGLGRAAELAFPAHTLTGTTAQHGIQFEVLEDRAGRRIFRTAPSSPMVSLAGRSPAVLAVTAPSVVEPGGPLVLRLHATDPFGNPRSFRWERAEVRLIDRHQESRTVPCRLRERPRPTGPPMDDFAWPQGALAAAELVAPAEPGFYWAEVTVRGGSGGRAITGRSHPFRVSPSPALRLLWGDLHAHSSLSDGAHPPEFAYAYAREVAALDFCAVTDHDDVGSNPNVDLPNRKMDEAGWGRLQHAANAAQRPGSFATLVGYEWTQTSLGYEGHRNVYHAGDRGALVASFSNEGATPARLFDELARRGTRALVIPHHFLHYMSPEHDPRFQRLVEIHSSWGTSEREQDSCRFTGTTAALPARSGFSARKALSWGYRVGFVGGSDSHESLPGRCYPPDRFAARRMIDPAGLTALWAPEVSREAVFDGLWARHCYATTGVRTWLWFAVRPGGILGDEVPRAEGQTLELMVAGTAPIREVVVFYNGEPWWTEREVGWSGEYTIPPPAGEGSAWCYVRVEQADGARAWSSPIWVDEGS